MKPFAVRVTPGLRMAWTSRGPRLAQVPVVVESLPAALAAAIPLPPPATPSPRGKRPTSTERAADALATIRRLHLAEVVGVERPTIPVDPSPTAEDLLPALEKSMLKGISGLARRRRRAARVEAAAQAARDAQQLAAESLHRQRVAQAECDGWWTRLANADPAAVYSFAIEAFERAAIPAALVDVHGPDLTVVTTVAGSDTLPTRMPSQNAKGQPSTRTMLRGERADLYITLVTAHAVLTLRQVFALLPFAGTVRLVVLRDSGVGALGLRRLDPLLCVVSPRSTFLRSVRPESTAIQTLRAGCRDVLQNVDAGTLQPIPLDHQEGLKDLMHAIDRV